MKSTRVKFGAVAALTGVLCGFGGCLSWDTLWGKAFWGTAIYTGAEYLLDNDAVIDLFEDGAIDAAN